jgi:uncharacterized membrane protein (UPF0127 family)
MQISQLNRAVLLAAMTIAGAARAEEQVMELNAGIHVIRAELAYTDAVRMQGLMYRKQLGPNQGMLFVFPELGRECMWMKNTLIPLSVAFMDEKGAILNIEDMAPQTENSHCSKGPARYALEMDVGWFKSHGMSAGGRIGGIERAPRPQ